MLLRDANDTSRCSTNCLKGFAENNRTASTLARFLPSSTSVVRDFGNTSYSERRDTEAPRVNLCVLPSTTRLFTLHLCCWHNRSSSLRNSDADRLTLCSTKTSCILGGNKVFSLPQIFAFTSHLESAKANVKKIDNRFIRPGKVYHQFYPLQRRKATLLPKSLHARP